MTCLKIQMLAGSELGVARMKRAGIMSYYDAALQVLRSVQRPLTISEITDQAIERGLLTPRGKTPYDTMRARLYTAAHNDPESEVVKLEEPERKPGSKRPRLGSVYWTLRNAPDTVADRHVTGLDG
jgi:hypothetical protein